MITLFIDYDNLLIGRIPYLDPYNFYGSAPGGPNQHLALKCIRYAIEEILKWNEDDAIKKFDKYIIRVMNLTKLVDYIDFPIEVPHGHPKYILSLLYPKRVHLNQQQLVEETFMSVLDARKFDVPTEAGEENEKSGKQFPREYFSGGLGFRRFCYCIKFLIENYRPVSSVEEIYAFFDSPEGKNFLYNYRLKVPADQFSINMLDVIHYITKDEPDSDLYYTFCSFKKEFNSLRRINTLNAGMI